MVGFIATGLIFLIAIIILQGLASLTIQKNVGGSVITGNSNISVTDAIGINANPNVIAAQPGVLTTHTTNTTGLMTMTNSNHGIITGQRIDIFWAGGRCYDVAITVSGTAITITGVTGGGSNLPASGTAVTVGISTSAPFVLTGNNLTGLAAIMPPGQNGYVVFSTGSDVLALYLQAGAVYDWTSFSTTTNPLAGNSVTLVYISHDNVGAAVAGIQVAAVAH